MVRRLTFAHTVQYSLAICWLFAAACPLRAQEDDGLLRGHFLKGVAETAKELEHLSFRATFLFDRSWEKEGVPGEVDTRRYEVAIRGPSGLETGVNERSGNVFFKVRNNDYSFSLEQTPEGKRTSLQFVEQMGIDPAVDAQIAALEEIPRGFALGGYYLWTDPLYRLVKADAFTITNVYAIVSGAEELVRVEFEYSVDDPTRQLSFRITDGFLVCDPARKWALTEYGGTEYNLINKDKVAKNAVLEYGETIGGIPIATKITRTLNLISGDYKSETVLSAEIISRDVPSEEFYLTHYGLPEPNFEQSWFGIWAWYLIGGIGCFVIGTAIIRRRRSIG